MLKNAKEIWKKAGGDPKDETFKKLVELDHTRQKKYLEWIVKQYISSRHDGFHERVKELVKQFHDNVGNMSRKDINAYALDELDMELANIKARQSKDQLGLKALKENVDYKVIINEQKLKAYDILAYEGSRAIGGNDVGPKFKSGSTGKIVSVEWCTVASEAHFKSYTDNKKKLYYVMDLAKNAPVGEKWAINEIETDKGMEYHVYNQKNTRSGPEVLAHLNLKKIIPLENALFSRDKAAIIAALDNGANINHMYSPSGNTPLTHAIREDDTAIAKLLLERGADCNLKDKEGRTPLFIAAARNAFEIVKMLVEANSDVDESWKGWTPLCMAAREGHDTIVKLLIEGEANVNFVKDDEWTPLMLAASNNRNNAIEQLLQAGANRTLTNGDGKTALDLAIEKQKIVAGDTRKEIASKTIALFGN